MSEAERGGHLTLMHMAAEYNRRSDSPVETNHATLARHTVFRAAGVFREVAFVAGDERGDVGGEEADSAADRFGLAGFQADEVVAGNRLCERPSHGSPIRNSSKA
jgi:hypothetical protein